MNKRELIDQVGSETGASRGTVKEVVEGALAHMARALEGGDEVVLPGFGTFEVRSRAARTGRNPQTGEQIDIAASKAVAFKPSAALKRVVNPR